VYQIARGLLLPFTLLLSLELLRPRPYFPPLLIMAGFVGGMGSDGSKMLTSGNGILLGIGRA
jgi:GDP-fucose transporter C1